MQPAERAVVLLTREAVRKLLLCQGDVLLVAQPLRAGGLAGRVVDLPQTEVRLGGLLTILQKLGIRLLAVDRCQRVVVVGLAVRLNERSLAPEHALFVGRGVVLLRIVSAAVASNRLHVRRNVSLPGRYTRYGQH